MAEETQRRRRPRQRLLTLDYEASERHASWLELFFDLVYVFAVSKVAAILVDSPDIYGFLKYLVLFVPVWWSWVGFTFYADRFESDEIEYRVLTFASMLAIAALSISIGGAFSLSGDASFVGCYAAVRLMLVAQYTRTAYYVPVGRRLAMQYMVGFGVAVLILLASLMVEPPVRYYIWAMAMLIELATPFIDTKLTRIIPFDHSHIPERFGLFTIIVLGEAVIATANGASGVPWNLATTATASLGFAMAACIWWINFDFVEDDAIKSQSLMRRFIFIVSHFCMVASIVVIGIGVEHAIKDTIDGHPHLATVLMLGGGTAAYLTAITAVRLASGVCNVVTSRLIAIAVCIAAIFFGSLVPPVALVAILLTALAAGVWFEDQRSEEYEKAESVPQVRPCGHADEAVVFHPRSDEGCEECVKNNYKWVHLRMCLECGHVGCCDSSRYKHATRHFHEEDHPIMASLEAGDNWAWCYADERFVPLPQHLGKYTPTKIELAEQEGS